MGLDKWKRVEGSGGKKSVTVESEPGKVTGRSNKETKVKKGEQGCIVGVTR